MVPFLISRGTFKKGTAYFSYNGVQIPQGAVESPIASMELNFFVFTN